MQINGASDRLDKRKRKELQVLAAFYNTSTQKKDSYRNWNTKRGDRNLQRKERIKAYTLHHPSNNRESAFQREA